MNTPNPPALRALSGAEIGLSAAAYLEMGLEALRGGDTGRAIGCLASIEGPSWDAVLARFPGLPELMAAEVSQ